MYTLEIYNRYNVKDRKYTVKFTSVELKDEFVESELEHTKETLTAYRAAWDAKERAITGRKMYESRIQHMKDWNAKQRNQSIQPKELA